jgi:hypothetical protein
MLSRINAIFELAIQSPTAIARELVTEKFEGWRRALGGYQKALNGKSSTDPLLDLKNRKFGPAASGRFDGFAEF